MTRKAVVLLSGGLDSATVLATLRTENVECYALSFRYGQRHSIELECARWQAKARGVRDHIVVDLDFTALAPRSSLTNHGLEVSRPSNRTPNTYVPARNIVFLSIAAGWAESVDADRVAIGANAIDNSGYPDCGPAFLGAISTAFGLGMREGPSVYAPLLYLSKYEIGARAARLGVDMEHTTSCYQATRLQRRCGSCPACEIHIAAEQGYADEKRGAE